MIKVGVVIITYNFEKYILETLNSIANQTHKNIELVISDDHSTVYGNINKKSCKTHSTDRTNFIIEKWLEENKKRFRDVIFSKSNVNKGGN